MPKPWILMTVLALLLIPSAVPAPAQVIHEDSVILQGDEGDGDFAGSSVSTGSERYGSPDKPVVKWRERQQDLPASQTPYTRFETTDARFNRIMNYAYNNPLAVVSKSDVQYVHYYVFRHPEMRDSLIRNQLRACPEGGLCLQEGDVPDR